MWIADVPLARRIEDAQMWRGFHYVQAQARLRPESGSTAEPVAGGYILFAGKMSPTNKAAGLGMRGPVAADDLDRIERFFRSRGSATRVDVCPLADASVLALLNERGYRLHHFHSVLARPLDDSVFPVTLPPGMTITQAGPADADLWLRVTAEGFIGHENPGPEVLEIQGPNFYAEGATCYLAWLDAQPAGGGGMYMHEQSVSFGSGSTRMPFRRRGVQMALLQTRMAAARQAGCDLAVVTASPGSGSQRNIERVGFTLAYTIAIMVKE